MSWKLSCGHTVPFLEHDKPDDPPRQASNVPGLPEAAESRTSAQPS